MRNKARKLISFALVSAMVLSLVPSNLPTYAAENDSTTIEVAEEGADEETVVEEQPEETSTEVSVPSETPSEEKTEDSTEIGIPTTEETTEAVAEEKTEENKDETVSEEATSEETTTEEATEETIEETIEETTEEETIAEPVPTFDTTYDGVSVAGLDFSSCELLIATEDSSIFTADTDVVSEYNGIYLTRYPDPIQTMNAYTYYYTRASLVEVNSSVKATDVEGTEEGSDDSAEEGSGDDGDVPQQTDDIEAPEVSEEIANEGHGEADLSNLNNSDDAFSNVDGVGVANYSGYIALIDTGASEGVKKSVSVIGDGTGDDNGHGTKMARAILEANPNANIISIKALGSNAVGSVQDVYTAIEYAINANVSVINLSMASITTADSELLRSVIAEAQNRGIVVVASAGNNGSNASYYTPANIAGVKTIGACDKDGNRISSSNYGSVVNYYVVADSTSLAAAKFSGYAVMGLDKVEENDDVFTREYVESEKKPENKEEEKSSEGDSKEDVEEPKEEAVKEDEKTSENKEDISPSGLDTVTPTADNMIEKLLLKATGQAKTEALSSAQRLAGVAGCGISGVSNAANAAFNGFPDELYATNVSYYCYQNDAHGRYSGVLTSVGTVTGKWGSTWYNTAIDTDADGYRYNIWYNPTCCAASKIYGTNLECPTGGSHSCGAQYFVWAGWKGDWGYYVGIIDDGTSAKQSICAVIAISHSAKPKSYLGFNKTIDGTAKSGIWFEAWQNDEQFIGYYVTGDDNGGGAAWYLKDGSGYKKNEDGKIETEVGTSITLYECGLMSGFNLTWDGFYYTPKNDTTGGNVQLENSDMILISRIGYYKKITLTTVSDTDFMAMTSANVPQIDNTTPPPKTGVALYKYDDEDDTPLSTAGFTVYNAADDSVIGTMVNEGAGKYSLELTYNAYTSVYAKETTVPDGYIGTTDKIPLQLVNTFDDITYDNIYNYATDYPNVHDTYLYLVKKSAVSSATGSNYTLDATYGIYTDAACTNKVGEVTTNSSTGESAPLKVSDWMTTDNNGKYVAKTFYAKEISTNAPGFVVNTTVYSVQVTGANDKAHPAKFEAKEPARPYVYLEKDSSNTSCTNNNPNYDLTGAEYKVFRTKSDAETARDSGDYSGAIATLTTDANGVTNYVDVSSYMEKNNDGTFKTTTLYAVESKAANKGYLKSKDVAEVEVTPDNIKSNGTINAAKFKVEDVPVMDPIEFELNKVDALDHNRTVQPTGDSSLEGAQFTVSFYAKDINGGFDNSWTPDRSWILETKKDNNGDAIISFNYINSYKVSGDEWYRDDNYRIKFPYGFIKIEETKAPKGYNLTGEFSGKDMNNNDIVSTGKNYIVIKTTADGVVTTGNVLINENYGLWKDDQPIRADIDITKVDENGEPMAGVEYVVTSKTTRQSVTLVTDENGYVSTASSYVSHKTNTNAGTAKCGTWFGDLNQISDDLGALFWDEYEIKEKRSSANDGKQLELVRTVTKDEIENNAGKVITVIDKGAGDPEGKNWNQPKPIIHTTASSKEFGGKFLGQETDDGTIDTHNQTIIDEITYLNLRAGTDYTFVSEVMIVDKEKNEVGPYTELDANGNEVPYKRIHNFTTNANYTKSIYEKVGIETVELDGIDPAGYENKYFVVYETLYLGTYTSLDQIPAVAVQYPEYSDEDDMKIFPVEHRDPTDDFQTLPTPDIHTELTDNVSEDHIGFPKDDKTITDKVSYTGLVIGDTYTISGTLMAKPSTKWNVIRYQPNSDKADKDGLVYEEIDDGSNVTEYILKDENGQPITSSKTFVADKEDGFIELEFTVDAALLAGQSIIAKEELRWNDLLVSAHTDLEDRDEFLYLPDIRTTTRNSNTNIEDDSAKEILANEDGSFTDKISYHNLIANRTYKVKGILMDKDTGKEMLDADGNKIVAETTFKTKEVGEVVVDLSPDAVNYKLADGTLLDMSADHADYMCDGTVDLVFEGYDITNLANKVGVVFEEIYLVKNDKEILVQEHKKIDDVDQFTYFIQIGTKAEDATTKSKVVPYDVDTVLEDVVSYKNVIPGKEYTLQATLVVKNDNTGKYKDGDQLLDKDGKTITVTHTFTPKEKEGEETVSIKLNTAPYKDMEIVVFEDMYNEHGLEVALHAELEDEGQTLEVPGGGTKAKDKATGDEVSSNQKSVTIIDTITYRNLEVGKEFTATGVLYDKETKAPLKDANGKEITNTVKFTPTQKNGTIDVPFEIDASLLAGKTIVCFEDILYKDKKVFIHHDLEDKEQSVYIPKIGTTATFDNGEKIKKAEKETTIVDKCEYKNLVPGKSYKISGCLYDKATGDKLVINGKNVTAEKTFTPETADGFVELTFTFDASSLNTKIVVFEYLYHNEKEVGSHTDISDEGQTVYIPKIGTTANFADGSKTQKASKTTTIVDKVEFKGLIPGKEYKISGCLYNKSTGDKLVVNGKNVTAEKTFTPETEDGYVELEFTFDSTGLSTDVVVFEYLYHKDTEIATHTNLEDKGQTVTIVPPNAPPKTGMTIFFVLLGLMAAGGIGMFLSKKKSTKTE